MECRPQYPRRRSQRYPASLEEAKTAFRESWTRFKAGIDPAYMRKPSRRRRRPGTGGRLGAFVEWYRYVLGLNCPFWCQAIGHTWEHTKLPARSAVVVWAWPRVMPGQCPARSAPKTPPCPRLAAFFRARWRRLAPIRTSDCAPTKPMPWQGTVSPEGSTIGERTEPLGDKLAREYRAYTVGSDGRFIGFEPLVCADDPEAIQKAKRLINGHEMELWSGSRLVVRLEASTPKLGSD